MILMNFMSSHVNIALDPTRGACFHILWPPPSPSPGGPVPSIEMLVTQMWTAGYVLGQNKFTTTVFHKGMPICIDSHDIGALIPDITIPFPNNFYAIMWPFSSRKMMFLSSTVQFDKKPVSCSDQVSIPPLPMLTCGDPISLPTAFPLINFLNTVIVGITFWDLFIGILKIAVSIAIDAIFEYFKPLEFLGNIDKKIADAISNKLGQKVSSTAVKKFIVGGTQVLGKVGLMPGALAKKAVSELAGWGISAMEGNPTFKFAVGGGVLPEIGFKSDDKGPGVHFGNAPNNDPLNIFSSPEPSS